MPKKVTRKLKFKMKEQEVRLGKVRMRVFEMPDRFTIMLNFGRYKKRRKVDTWTIYNAITEKHKPAGDEIWLDIQDRRAIGLTITLDK
jgi:hypothetical protein